MSGECPCGMTRRKFLQAAGGAACLAMLPIAGSAYQKDPITRTPMFWKGRANVTLVFTHTPTGTATWPAKDYDYEARARELTAALQRGCTRTTFSVKTAHNAAEAEAIVNATPNTEGYVVYALGIWTGAPNVFARSGKPIVLVDDLFAGSGEILIMSGVARREKLPVAVVSSSNMQDVIVASRLFEVIHCLKESTILDVVDYDIGGPAERIRANFGCNVIPFRSDKMAAYYAKTDDKEAARWADYWMRNARKVVEPTRDELIKSGKMHLALCRAAQDFGADAVSMDCLGMFYSGRITAYPCLSFFQMNNDGGTGVCEGDLNSTVTQLMMRYMSGRPGYVSDPVIDTDKGEIIYAHCVATNRVFGADGKANPYIIRSHAEDGQGASVQSLMPGNEPVTTLITDVWNKRMVIHTGKTTRNVSESKACRTKLAAKANVERILDNWDMGWHRVTVYGDWRKQAINLARLYGMEVFEEDKPV